MSNREEILWKARVATEVKAMHRAPPTKFNANPKTFHSLAGSITRPKPLHLSETEQSQFNATVQRLSAEASSSQVDPGLPATDSRSLGWAGTSAAQRIIDLQLNADAPARPVAPHCDEVEYAIHFAKLTGTVPHVKRQAPGSM